MHGWLKVAKKHWSDCVISEGRDHMDVMSPSGELLVSARRDGSGGMQCAQKETKCVYPLSVLQAEGNLAIEEKKLAAAAKKEAEEQAS